MSGRTNYGLWETLSLAMASGGRPGFSPLKGVLRDVTGESIRDRLSSD